jgi:hypothetical protein
MYIEKHVTRTLRKKLARDHTEEGVKGRQAKRHTSWHTNYRTGTRDWILVRGDEKTVKASLLDAAKMSRRVTV